VISHTGTGEGDKNTHPCDFDQEQYSGMMEVYTEFLKADTWFSQVHFSAEQQSNMFSFKMLLSLPATEYN